MPIYEYSALNAKGKTVTDIMDAESVNSARQKLRSANIYPLAIREVYDKKTKKSAQLPFITKYFSPKVKQSELAMMTRQLATLISAGFPLVSGIYTLVPQTSSHIFKQVLSQTKDAIEAGSSFADALSSYPETFSDMYVNMVRSGESSGTLELVLERLADILEKQQKLTNSIRSALTYPILMLIIGILVLYFLLAYVVPKITAIFSDMGQTLPAPTRFLIATSEFFKSGWWMLLLVIAGIFFGINRLKKSEKGRLWYDKTKLSLPGIGLLTTKLAVARFSRTLGTLLENGVSLLQALRIVKNIVGNRVIADAIEAAAVEVEKGSGLGKALDASKIFPHISIQMIQVGEQSGALETMLSKMADIYENDVENTVVGLSTLLEPIIILFMGVLVGFIVLSILLPIFEMNQLIK
ncbi:MAG: type II secretion system protein GspF [Desulfobacteraceae bacterium]|nr:MAG: type II secretion system protein GspF [Desulfobacteraceae bacterium]